MIPQAQDIEAERAVLGSMMIEGEAAGLALEILRPEDFYAAMHQEIFEAIEFICDSGEDPDQLLVRDHLEGTTHFKEIENGDYLHDLVMSVPSAANIARYAGIVKEHSIRRQLIDMSTANLRDAQDAGDVQDLLNRCEERMYEITGIKSSSDVVDLANVMQEQLRIMREYQDGSRQRVGLLTHLPGLDDLTNGFQKSDLILLAARPSVGKTALVMNFLYQTCHVDKKSALLFSLEMSKKQIADRFFGSICRIPSNKFLKLDLQETDWKRIESFKPVDNLLIDPTARISIPELRSKARRMKSRHDIAVIVVDYIQLMQGPSAKSREREVALISGSLKALAKELDIPVIGVCQLNRASEERLSGEPRIADLRESGTLEQDADVVMLLHRKRTQDGGYTGEGFVNLAKQRSGPTGKVPLVYLKEYMTFMESMNMEAIYG
jgi:replicative DNA helicase